MNTKKAADKMASQYEKKNESKCVNTMSEKQLLLGYLVRTVRKTDPKRLFGKIIRCCGMKNKLYEVQCEKGSLTRCLVLTT